MYSSEPGGSILVAIRCAPYAGSPAEAGFGCQAEGHVMHRSTRNKLILWGILVFGIFSYVGSYMWRSERGRYEPASIGLNGVKSYGWAPKGFVTDFRWNHTLMRAYFPLYYLDNRFWHTPDDAYRGNYPINKVSVDDIGKVYRATK